MRLSCGVPLTVVLACLLFNTSSEPIPKDPELSQSLQVNKLVSRRLPLNSTAELPPVEMVPSPSSMPLPVNVSLNVSPVGNEVIHRNYLDYPEGLQIIIMGSQFGATGNITKWRVYTGRNCILSAQVLRPIETPDNIFSTNDEPVHGFEVVGTNLLDIEEMGYHEFEIEDDEQIQAEAGDVIGFFTMNPGCVSWSQGGSFPVQYRYGAPTYRQVKSFKGILTVGQGLLRTYSIDCDFLFPNSTVTIKPSRTSPSNSPSNWPSPSITPSVNPITPSPSLTPLPSSEPSASATASISWTPSVSMSPSVTPTSSLNEMICTQGLEIVCGTEETMHLCNLSEELCLSTLKLMNVPLPEFLANVKLAVLAPGWDAVNNSTHSNSTSHSARARAK